MNPVRRSALAACIAPWIPLITIVGAQAGGLCGAREAFAAPKADATVYLPVARMRVPVPGRASDWIVDDVQSEGAKIDMLRTSPGVQPVMGFSVRLYTNGATCSTQLNAPLSSFPSGARKVRRPSYLPASFVAEAIESPMPGGTAALVCSNTRAGSVVLKIVYKGTRFERDVARLRATFEAIAKEAASRGVAPAPPTRTDPTPSPTPSPVPTQPPRLSSVAITLGTAGATVRLPEGWRHEFVNEMQQPGRDVLSRQRPGELELAIGLEPPARGHTCSEWYASQRSRSDAQMRERPAYAPSSFFHAVRESGGESSKYSKANLCLDTKDNGLMEVMLVYEGSLSDPDVRAAHPVLEQIASSILATPRVPDLAPPAALSASAPVAASPSSPSADTKADAPKSSASLEEIERRAKKRREERERAGRRSSRDDDDSPSILSGVRLELSGYQVKPEDGAYESATGGTIRLHMTHLDEPGKLTLAAAASAMIGADSATNIPVDFDFGLGAGVPLGPLRLIPLFKIGADSMGGGDAGRYKVPAAFYYAAEGQVSLPLAASFGIGGSIGRAYRGSVTGHGNSEVPREDRLSAYLWIRGISLGARFVDYGTGKLTAGTLGWVF